MAPAAQRRGRLATRPPCTWHAHPTTNLHLTSSPRHSAQAADMAALFDLSTVEGSMGGGLTEPLFELQAYGQRMKVRACVFVCVSGMRARAG